MTTQAVRTRVSALRQLGFVAPASKWMDLARADITIDAIIHYDHPAPEVGHNAQP